MTYIATLHAVGCSEAAVCSAEAFISEDGGVGTICSAQQKDQEDEDYFDERRRFFHFMSKVIDFKTGKKYLASRNTSLMTSEERLLMLFAHPKILNAIPTKPSEYHSNPNRTSEERERKSNESSQLKTPNIRPKPQVVVVSSLATTKNRNPNGTKDQYTRNQHYKTTCFAIINVKTSRGK